MLLQYRVETNVYIIMKTNENIVPNIYMYM